MSAFIKSKGVHHTIFWGDDKGEFLAGVDFVKTSVTLTHQAVLGTFCAFPGAAHAGARFTCVDCSWVNRETEFFGQDLQDEQDGRPRSDGKNHWRQAGAACRCFQNRCGI
jgi:hypothetical protein